MLWRYHLLEITAPQQFTQIASWAGKMPTGEEVNEKLIKFRKPNFDYILVQVMTNYLL